MIRNKEIHVFLNCPEKSTLVLNTIDSQGNKRNAAKSQCKKKSKKKVLIMWKIQIEKAMWKKCVLIR